MIAKIDIVKKDWFEQGTNDVEELAKRKILVTASEVYKYSIVTRSSTNHSQLLSS